MKFKLDIVTPERIVWSGDADQVTLPTQQGEITVLARHVPIVSILEPGEIMIRRDKETVFMAVAGGFVQVTEKQTTILADAAERAEEIDLERAERARERARQLMAQKTGDKVRDAEIFSAFQRSLIRIKVAGRRRKRTE